MAAIKVKLGDPPKPWTVKVANLDREMCDGWCDGQNRVITINVGLEPRRMAVVVAHEVLHAECFDLSEITIDRMAESVVAAYEKLGILPKPKK